MTSSTALEVSKENLRKFQRKLPNLLALDQMITWLFNFLRPLVQAELQTDQAKSFLRLWAVLAGVNVWTEEYGPLSHQMQIMAPIQQKPSVFHTGKISRDVKPG